MRTTVSRIVAPSVVLFALACGAPPTPPAPVAPGSGKRAAPAFANTGQVTVHVEGMRKKLGLT